MRYCPQGLPPRGAPGAWLYRLAIRESSTASVTHRSGTHGESRATTATLSAPVLDAGNTSPHLAPLFRRAGLRSARQSAPHSKRFDNGGVTR